MLPSTMRPSSTSDVPLVHQAWQKCVDRLCPPLSTDDSTRLFHQYIYDRYTEPQRHYHTLQHLEEMLGYLAKYERDHGWLGDYVSALSIPAAATAAETSRAELDPSSPHSVVRHDWMGTVLLLSILFHDVVYDPKRSDNEEVSAEVALDFLSATAELYKTSCENLVTAAEDVAASSATLPLLWADPAAADFVRATTKDYILKTKVHLSVEPTEKLRLSAPPSPSTVERTHDDPLHVFLDLDLSILGHADPEVYRERYAANIQREYSHHPRIDFVRGRSAFLNSFLGNPQWFKTPYFFALLEAQARKNIAAEAAELTAELKELQSANSSTPAS